MLENTGLDNGFEWIRAVWRTRMRGLGSDVLLALRKNQERATTVIGEGWKPGRTQAS